MLTAFAVFVALILSAFFSGMEIALLQSNKLQFQVWHSQKIRFAETAVGMRKDPERIITMVLIGNNLSMVAFSSYFAHLLFPLQFSEATIIILSSTVILIFGEVLPKIVFSENANILFLRFSFLTQFFVWLFSPAIKLINLIKKQTSEYFSEYLTLESLVSTIDEVEKQGIIDPVEEDLISRVLSIRRNNIKHVMTEWEDVVFIEPEMDAEKIRNLIEETHFSRYPVYDPNIGRVIGIFVVKDFIQHPDQIMQRLLPVYRINEDSDCLRIFQQQKVGMAIVSDIETQPIGIVTIKDLLDLIFKGFSQIMDSARERIEKIDDDRWIVNAECSLKHIADSIQIRFPTGKNRTLVEFLSAKLDKNEIKLGKEITWNNWRFTLMNITKNKIETVKIEKK